MNEHFIGNDIELYVSVRYTFLIVYILAEKVGVSETPPSLSLSAFPMAQIC